MLCRSLSAIFQITLIAAVLSHSDESCTSGETAQRRSLIQLNRRQQPYRQLTIDQLSPELRAVGSSLFGSEQKVAELLSISYVVDINYAGVPMQIMMAMNDDAISRYGPGLENGEEYGLDTLMAEQQALGVPPGSKMLNMIDFGANLGVVSIAVFKKYPGLVRAVVVEPAPTTYFYLATNLWLNQVPPLQGPSGTFQAGIAGLQKAVANDPNFQLTMCIPGHEMLSGSMNAHVISSPTDCACGTTDICSSVAAASVNEIFGYFGNEDITFVKMDCEACELAALPAMDAPHGYRVKRFAGEMHMMPPNIVDIACKYNNGLYLTGMCEAAGPVRVYGADLCAKCSSFAAPPLPVPAPAVDPLPVPAPAVDVAPAPPPPEDTSSEEESPHTAPSEPSEDSSKDSAKEKDKAEKSASKMTSKSTSRSRARRRASSPKTTESQLLRFEHLPPELKELGIKLFGTRQKLDKLLDATQVVPVSFDDVEMKLAMAENDDAVSRFGPGADNGEEYGMDTIMKKGTSGMLNLIDLGANLGVVTIAIFKKYPKKVRAVSVEPVPTTYFYFVVNLWLNDVPQLRTGDDFTKAGVVAVQKAISRKKGFKLKMCIPGHDKMSGSMNAYPVTPEKPCRCEDGGPDLCSDVSSVNLASIFEVYGDENIHFLKMDCEGCEEDALPALEEGGFRQRVLRLAGEVHMMPPKIYDLICQYNAGEYLTGMCKRQWPDRLYGKELCAGCSSRK